MLIGKFFWNAISQYSKEILSLIILLYLSRELSPQIIGEFGMAMTAINMGLLLTNFGFANALIQADEDSPIYWSSVLYLQLAISSILAIVLFISASLIADYYNVLIVKDLIRVLSISIVVTNFYNLLMAKLQKDLAFKSSAIVNLLSTIIAGIFAIVFLHLDYGVWSLAIRYFLFFIIGLILSLYFAKIKFILSFSMNAIKRLIKYSLGIFGVNVLNYINYDFDRILIGGTLGADALGAISQSRSTALQGMYGISGVFNKVVFPFFSKNKFDLVKVNEIFGYLFSLIVLGILPLMSFVFFYSGDVIEILLGSHWMIAEAPLKVFCLVSIIMALSSFANHTLLALGYSGHMLFVTIVSSIVYGLLLILFISKSSIVHVATYFLMAQLIYLIITFSILKRKIDYPVLTKLLFLGTITILTLISYYFSFYLINKAEIHYLLLFAIRVAMFFGIYSFLVFLFFRKYLKEVFLKLKFTT